MIVKTFKSELFCAVFFCMASGIHVKAQSTLADAITFSKNEQYDKAEVLFQHLIKGDPGNSKLYYYYGRNTLLNYFADTISNSLTVVAQEAGDLFNKGISVNASEPLNYIGLARIAFLQGNDAKAEKLRVKAKSLLLPYKKISRIANPKDYAFTLAKLAESYISFGQVDSSKAFPFIREALLIDSKNSETYIIAGDIYIIYNDGSNAIKNYNLAQDWNPKSPTANMKIGSIYVRGRNLMAAIPYYEQAIALNKDFSPAYRELGQLYSMAGRFDESKKYFEKYLELTKGNIPAQIRYVNALYYGKEYKEVIKNVEDIVAVDNSRAYLNRIAGYSAYEQGDYDLALSYLDKLFVALSADHLIKKDYIYYARTLIRKNQNYPKLVIDTDNDIVNLTKLQEKFTSAKSSDNMKIKAEVDTLNSKVTAEKAQIATAENELNKAFNSYEKAIMFSGEDANIIIEKASFLYANKKYKIAAETWSRLLDKGKDSENDYLQIGRTYYQAKDFDNADEIFNKMVVKYPENIQGYLWIANNALAKDPDSELDLAKPKFLKVLEVASSDSVKNAQEIFNALKYLGYNALQDKRYEEAKDYYNRMLNLAPNNKEFELIAYSSLSSMYLQTGEFSKATEVNNKILAIDPGNENAKSTIQYIVSIQKSSSTKANPNEISGVITDTSSQPIASASVRVKDTACEAWTNANGEYRFVMPEVSKTIIISAKGYRTILVTVTKKRVYNATLSK
jgi:tetratricopeptide (TPR) repeat protein